VPVTLNVFPASMVAAVLAAAATDGGLRFPAACAPFAVHVIALPGGADVEGELEALSGRGFDILIDDREASAGVKFADADWIGAPVRIVSGRKSAEAGGVEVTVPQAGGRVVLLGSLGQALEGELAALM
jgi:prolyl-tRNA synthetase